MVRGFVIAAGLMLGGLATPADAQSQKERTCAIQGAVMGAVQQARLDGVRQNKLVEAVQQANPDLSEEVLATVPAIGSHVYGIKKRDLRKVDLGQIAQTQCLENYEQIQALQNSLSD